MSLLVGQLVFTNFPVQGFRTLASPGVPTDVQQAFIRHIAHRYWDSYNPPEAHYRAAYLHQVRAEQLLFGWLYNDGWDDLGRGYVPYFVCYYLEGPLDTERLQAVLKCLRQGPMATVDRTSSPTALVDLQSSSLERYFPAVAGIELPKTFLADCQAALAQGQRLDCLITAEAAEFNPQDAVYDLLGTLGFEGPSELAATEGSSGSELQPTSPTPQERSKNFPDLQQALNQSLAPFAKQIEDFMANGKPSLGKDASDVTPAGEMELSALPMPPAPTLHIPTVKVALLIGVSDYGAGFKPLPAAIDNLEAIKQGLLHPDIGGFTEVKTLLNGDPLAVQEAVEALASDRQPEDLLLLYFCGHGIQDQQGRLHLATRLARRTAQGDLVRSGAVLTSFIHETLGESQAQHQVVILDCCFTTAKEEDSNVEGLDVATQLGAAGRVVMTGTTSSQSYLEQTASGTSAYTYYLVEGLRTGIADLGNDGMIAVTEWHDYAATKVRKAAPAIKPVIYGEQTGSQLLIAPIPAESPQFQYRKEVEQLTGYGEISAINRSILDILRERLALSTTQAATIEGEVLKPYQEYQTKLQQYTQALAEAMHREPQLSEATCGKLRDFQRSLGLTDEAIALVEDQVTRQMKAAGRAKLPVALGTTVPLIRSTQRTNQPDLITEVAPEGRPRSFLDLLQPPQRKIPWRLGVGAIAGLALVGALSIRRGPEGQASRQQQTPTNWQTQQAQTLSGHTNPVGTLAISPDSKLLASGSTDKTLKLWNLEPGILRQTLSGHGSAVWAVAFSSDGQLLASGSGDKTIKLWQAADGQLLNTLIGHQDTVWAVAFSSDGQLLASGSGDQTIKLWQVETGALLSTFSGHADAVRTVAISPDGQTLVSGSYDQTIKIWDLKTGELRRTLSGHTGRVISVAVSPDGQTLASGSEDQTIKIWDLNTGALRQTLSGHSDWVTSITIAADGQTLASGSEDKTIKIWDLSTGALRQTLSGLGSDVYAVTISPDQQNLTGSIRSGTIKVWRQ
jgi:hypothetical protein